MRATRTATATAGIGLLVLSLTGCVAAPDVDWADAQQRADQFTRDAVDSDSALGSGTLRVTSDAESTPLDPDDGVVFDYRDTVRIDQVTVACFGTGTVTVGYAARAGSSWLGSEAVSVTCDGDPVSLEGAARGARINAVRVNAHVTDGRGAVVATVIRGEGTPA